MRISIYDTYVQRPDGRQMHFDILVPSDISKHEVVLDYGRRCLETKGLSASVLRAEKCNYCHMESVTSPIDEEIAINGFAIIEMENCNTLI